MKDMTQPTPPEELTDREIVNTAIGPVCMSRTEYEMYRTELELRRARESAPAPGVEKPVR